MKITVEFKEDSWRQHAVRYLKWFLATSALLLTVFLMCCTSAQAQNGGSVFWAKPSQIADAIYIAEGGARTSHPYGILAHYRHTTPRQACINTINHALRDWNGQGDFIAFLGSRYCPVGAKNDPKGLNKNWIKNVNYYLYKR